MLSRRAGLLSLWNHAGKHGVANAGTGAMRLMLEGETTLAAETVTEPAPARADAPARPGPTGRRFLFLDSLRGMAAVGVVIHHAIDGGHVPGLMAMMPGWLLAALAHSGLAVSIFFALSGFVIAHSVYAHRVTTRFAARFMLRRSIRLDPPYWFAIALVLGFSVLSASVVAGKSPFAISTAQALANIFYLQDILGYPHINKVFWTLCLEIQFYLVYITLLCMSRNDPNEPVQGRRTAAVLVLAMMVSLLWPLGVLHEQPWPGSFLPLWHGFLIGVLAYMAWRNPGIVPFYLGVLFAIVTAALLHGEMFSVVCAFTSLLIWYFAISGRIYTALNWSPLQFLGMISYSLCLTHNPVTGATFRVGFMMTGETPFWEAFWWLGSLAACVAFAAAVWFVVEKPSIRWARTITMRKAASLA